MDNGLPQDVSQGIEAIVSGAKEALGDELVSVVLFGSAAEGRLREDYRLAHATIRLEAMLILESEVGAASEALR